ncbi:hypothetical protein Trydic_g4843 [Trypoxylus dichotomus]
MILFMSDNGGQTFGMHENFASNWPLRGLKFTHFEGGVRGTAVFYNRNLKKKGSNNDNLMHITDLLPTFYTAAGTIYNNSYDGFHGVTGQEPENPEYNVLAVIRSPTNAALKYLRNDCLGTDDILDARSNLKTKDCRRDLPKDLECSPCLFDLWDDPCETKNIAAEEPLVTENLSARIREFWKVLVPQQNKDVDPDSNPANFGGIWTTNIIWIKSLPLNFLLASLENIPKHEPSFVDVSAIKEEPNFEEEDVSMEVMEESTKMDIKKEDIDANDIKEEPVEISTCKIEMTSLKEEPTEITICKIEVTTLEGQPTEISTCKKEVACSISNSSEKDHCITMASTSAPSTSKSTSWKDNSSDNVDGGTIKTDQFFKLIKSKYTPATTNASGVKCEPNIVDHLKRKHEPSSFQEYVDFITEYKRGKKQCDDNAIMAKRIKKEMSQVQFDESILKFVVHSMVPLKIVEEPSFRAIFKNLGVEDNGLKTMSRQSLCRRMKELLYRSKANLKSQFKTTQLIYTTVYVWPGRRRSFLGITAHWIANSLERHSAALACRRFPGTHSAESISNVMQQIYTDYGILHSQVRGTVTVNASNFMKAFQIYGVQKDCIKIVANGDSICNIEESDFDSDEEASAINISHTDNHLPSHLRCYVHTLHLCASVDLMKTIMKSDILANIHNKVMSKCNVLWKAASRPKSAEILQKVLGCRLSRPCETKWNSLYDSLRNILKIKDKSVQLYHALNISNPISEHEFIYIEEHLECTKAIAAILHVLQSETESYYGVVLPTLIALQSELTTLCKRNLMFCKPLADSLLKSVNKRFEDIYEFTSGEALDAAVAALSHPQFKNRTLKMQCWQK